MMNRIVRWIATEGVGVEHLRIKNTDDGPLAEAVAIGERGGAPYGLTYRIACDRQWRVREVDISLIGEDAQLRFRCDGAGQWADITGTDAPTLHGCVDVDIAATPFTNTLPISRLRLKPGESRQILVAYIAVPSLAVQSVWQRYTLREAGSLYHYEGLSSGFSCDLPVDADGIVLDYPGAFRRTA